MSTLIDKMRMKMKIFDDIALLPPNPVAIDTFISTAIVCQQVIAHLGLVGMAAECPLQVILNRLRWPSKMLPAFFDLP